MKSKLALLFYAFLCTTVFSQDKSAIMKKLGLSSGDEETATFVDKPQQSFTSSFHSNHVGEIVFSKDRVNKENPGVALVNRFDAADYIYARVFTDKSVENTNLRSPKDEEIRCRLCGYEYDLYVDGKKQSFVMDKNLITDSDEKQWITRQLWIHPKPKDEPTSINWVNLVNNLSPGKHTIALEYFYLDSDGSRSSEAVAKGSFELIKSANSNIKIGIHWSDIQPRMSDAGISSAVVSMANNDYSMTENGSKYLDAKILSTGWKTVYKPISGVPVYRWVEVNILERKKDGSCYVQNHAIRQEYMGSNTFSEEITWAGILEIYGYEGPLDCD